MRFPSLHTTTTARRESKKTTSKQQDLQQPQQPIKPQRRTSTFCLKGFLAAAIVKGEVSCSNNNDGDDQESCSSNSTLNTFQVGGLSPDVRCIIVTPEDDDNEDFPFEDEDEQDDTEPSHTNFSDDFEQTPMNATPNERAVSWGSMNSSIYDLDEAYNMCQQEQSDDQGCSFIEREVVQVLRVLSNAMQSLQSKADSMTSRLQEQHETLCQATAKQDASSSKKKKWTSTLKRRLSMSSSSTFQPSGSSYLSVDMSETMKQILHLEFQRELVFQAMDEVDSLTHDVTTSTSSVFANWTFYEVLDFVQDTVAVTQEALNIAALPEHFYDSFAEMTEEELCDEATTRVQATCLLRSNLGATEQS